MTPVAKKGCDTDFFCVTCLYEAHQKKQHFAYIFYVHIAYCERFFFVCRFFFNVCLFRFAFQFFLSSLTKMFCFLFNFFSRFFSLFFHFFSLIHDKDLYTSLILFLFLKKEEVSMAWKKFVLIVYTVGIYLFFNNFQLIIFLWQKVAKYLKQNKQLSFHQNKYDRNWPFENLWKQIFPTVHQYTDFKCDNKSFVGEIGSFGYR